MNNNDDTEWTWHSPWACIANWQTDDDGCSNGPQGKGIDIIETALIEGEHIKDPFGCYDCYGRRTWHEVFFVTPTTFCKPNALCLLVHTRKRKVWIAVIAVNATCESRDNGVPCALNSIDVGIAIGSALCYRGRYARWHPVMFSAGLAAQRLDWLKGCKMVMAIPVSASSKNPVFRS